MADNSYSASERRGVIIIAILTLLIIAGGVLVAIFGKKPTPDPEVMVLERIPVDSVALDTVIIVDTIRINDSIRLDTVTYVRLVPSAYLEAQDSLSSGKENNNETETKSAGKSKKKRKGGKSADEKSLKKSSQSEKSPKSHRRRNPMDEPV